MSEVATNSQVEVVTPGDHKVLVKGFLSGGDKDDLERVLVENLKFKVDSTTGEIDKAQQEISGTVMMDRTQKALKLLVLSVDGSTDNAYEAVRALPAADYDVVVAKVEELIVPLAKQPSTS